MEDRNPVVVEEIRFIKAPAERVFTFLTVGSELAKWWPMAAESEPKAGGKLVLVWFGENKLTTKFDTFVEGQAVAFAFYTESVAFDLKAEDEGTEWKVVHRCSTESCIHVAQSWGFLAANLKSVIETGYDLR